MSRRLSRLALLLLVLMAAPATAQIISQSTAPLSCTGTNCTLTSGQLILPDGTTTTPAVVGTNANTAGFVFGNNLISIAKGGQEFFRVNSSTGDTFVNLTGIGALRLGSAADANLRRDAANTLALVNGVNAQGFRIYNLDAAGSNDEWLQLQWASNRLTLGPTATGTGVVRDMILDFGLGVAFASLGTPANGQQVYCNDCKITTGTPGNPSTYTNNTCTSGGTGSLAMRLNGAWICWQ